MHNRNQSVCSQGQLKKLSHATDSGMKIIQLREPDNRLNRNPRT